MAWSRRTFLGAASLAGLALGLSPDAVLAALPAAQAPDARTLSMLRAVSDLVIPGAGAVGTGAFVALALAHGLDGTDPAARLDLWLAHELDNRAKGDFLKLPPARRHAVLAALDAEAFPPGPPPAQRSPWVALKGLILTGYYTSETGGSRDLRYEPVPGRWDHDIPLHPGDAAVSNDWTAIEFG